jgi:hypothetical protein
MAEKINLNHEEQVLFSELCELVSKTKNFNGEGF